MLINYVCRGMGNRCLSAALFISKRFQPAPKDGRRYKQKKKFEWRQLEADGSCFIQLILQLSILPFWYVT